MFLPMIAWDRPLRNAVAHTAGSSEPDPKGPCTLIWSFASGDTQYLGVKH